MLTDFKQPTISMEQNPPWETNSRSTGQESVWLSWNPNFYYSVYKSLLLGPIQVNAVRNLTQCFFEIHFNIILSSTPRSP
jgi:hypothetical protein